MARSRGLAADVEHVGSFPHHAQPLRDRALLVVAEAVAAERVGSDVHDSHHVGAASPLETAPTDVGDHAPIMLPFEMKLADIARGVPGARLEGNGDVEVTGIAYDSRRVKPGDLFVAVSGLHEDGHAFAADAVARGAVAVALERSGPMPAGTPVLLRAVHAHRPGRDRGRVLRPAVAAAQARRHHRHRRQDDDDPHGRARPAGKRHSRRAR